MIKSSFILTEILGSTATIRLNRPGKHNALNMEMITEFLQTIQYVNSLHGVRIIIIRGNGLSFCAGADLDWMRKSVELSGEENYSECETLARCFFELYNSTKITICLVHGAVIGGGAGFAAAADITVAMNDTFFAFGEVRLGLVPATIAPYVMGRTGRSKAIELMLTGRKFTAEEAMKWGLVSEVVQAEKTDEFLQAMVDDLLKGESDSQKIIKTRLHPVEKYNNSEEMIRQTASLLAEIRTGMKQ